MEYRGDEEDYRVQSTEYRLRSTDYGGKVGAWLCRVLVCIGGQGEALPLPAAIGRERQLGQHAMLPVWVALGRTSRGCPLRSEGHSRLKLRSLISTSIYRSKVRCKGPSSVTRALGSSSVRIAEEVVLRQKSQDERWDFPVPPSDEDRAARFVSRLPRCSNRRFGVRGRKPKYENGHFFARLSVAPLS